MHFYVCLASLTNIVFVRAIYFVACNCICSFPLCLQISLCEMPALTYGPLIDKHMNCFWFGFL